MKRTFNCKSCDKETTSKESRGREGRSKFCSKTCQYSKSRGDRLSVIIPAYESKVIRQDGCWGWKSSTNCTTGRGRVHYKRKVIEAHRASWMIHFGEIPEGKLVCHKCDNPVCSNPRHLFLGSYSDNAIDMVKKGRSSAAILDINKVKYIKDSLCEGVSQKELAKMFNVKPQTISEIERNKTWRYV